MKNDATFVRMRSGDHLGDAKLTKKRHLASSNLTFWRIAIDENVASTFLIFAWGRSYDFSKFSDDFTVFRLWKIITKSLGKNLKKTWGNVL